MKDTLEEIFKKHHFGFGEYNKEEIIKDIIELCGDSKPSEQPACTECKQVKQLEYCEDCYCEACAAL